jgi:hypothetical protein
MPDSIPPPLWGSPPFDERDLDALLAGDSAYVPVALRQVADALTALRAAPSPAELRSEAAIMAEFRALGAFGAVGAGEPARTAMPMVADGAAPTIVLPAGTESGRRRRRHRRTRWHARPSRIGPLVSVAAVLVIAAAVAYSGNLPGPAQRLAHITLAAPPPRQVGAVISPGVEDKSASAVPTPNRRATAAAPSIGGASQSATSSPSARAGKASICDAFIKSFDHQATGQEPWWKSADYAELSAAAGGPKRIPAYCAPAWAKLTPHSSPRLPDWPAAWPSIPETGNIGTGNGNGLGTGANGNATSQTGTATSGNGLGTPGQDVGVPAPSLPGASVPAAGDQGATDQGASSQGASAKSASDQGSGDNTGAGSGGLDQPVSGSRAGSLSG